MIEIDSMWLYEALDNHSGEVDFYLDRQTGEILPISEMFESEKEQAETYARIMNDRIGGFRSSLCHPATPSASWKISSLVYRMARRSGH
jgi:hypothetical protein